MSSTLSPSPHLRRLADDGDHVRLRDRLAVADPERHVVVGALRRSRSSDEELARHAAHRLEDARRLRSRGRRAAPSTIARALAGRSQAPAADARSAWTAAAAPRSGTSASGARSVMRASGGRGGSSNPAASIGTVESPASERAVASAAGVVAAAEVLELPALRGRDEHVAGVRARERAPDALEAFGYSIPGSSTPASPETAQPPLSSGAKRSSVPSVAGDRLRRPRGRARRRRRRRRRGARRAPALGRQSGARRPSRRGSTR